MIVIGSILYNNNLLGLFFDEQRFDLFHFLFRRAKHNCLDTRSNNPKYFEAPIQVPNYQQLLS